MNNNETISVKKTCIQWAKSSTLNGLSNFLEPNNIFVKILWFLFILISYTFCAFQIIEMIQDYLKYQVKSKVSLIDEVPSLFPILLICNVNFLNTNYGAVYAQNILSAYNNLTNNSITNAHIQYYLVRANTLMLNVTEKRRLGTFGSHINKTIIKCLYENLPCDLSDFEWHFDMNNGNCLKYNSKQTKHVYNSDLRTGLEIEIYIGYGDELNNLSNIRGVRLFLSDNPNISYVNSAIELPTGMSTSIEISKIYNQRLSDPYSNCRSKDYSQQNCKHNCYQIDLVKNCSCYDARFKYAKNDSKPCIEIKQILCIDRFNRDFYLSFENRLKCDLECPVECTTIKYDYKVSYANYPSEQYVEQYLINRLSSNETLTYESVKKSMIAFRMYFENLISLDMKDQPALSENDLKANIGGALSLFIGISIVSLGQIVEIIIRLTLIGVQKFRNRSEDTSTRI